MNKIGVLISLHPDTDVLCEMKKILNARFVDIQNNTTLFLRKEENEESK